VKVSVLIATGFTLIEDLTVGIIAGRALASFGVLDRVKLRRRAPFETRLA
jgi:hypothetical protein